jgi:hypothetical protein
MSKGALAHRIEVLEAHLSAPISDELQSPNGAEGIQSPDIGGNAPGSSGVSTQEPVDAEEPRGRKRAGPRPAPATAAYFGPSSGVTIAESLSRTVENSSGGWTRRTIPVTEAVAGEHEGTGPISLAPTAERQGKAAPPDDAVGKQLLDVFFGTIHKRLPFLDRGEIFRLHAGRYDAVNASAGVDEKHAYGMFKLFMLYAIGAAMLQ